MLFTCDRCGEDKSSKAELKDHQIVVHGGLPLLQCPLCHFKTRLQLAIRLHKRREHNVKNLYCQWCNEAFVDRKDLERHVYKFRLTHVAISDV